MLSFKNSVAFQKGEVPPVLLRNFFEPEDGFVWSSSTWSEVIFSFSDDSTFKDKSTDLILDFDVFRSPPALPHQTVKIYLNGLRIGSRDVADRLTTILTFDPGILKASENILTFDTPQATAPNQFGIEDSRRLGVQLFSLQLRSGG